LDQIVPEPEPKTSSCWSRSQKNQMPRAGALNLRTSFTALVATTKQTVAVTTLSSTAK